MIEHLTKRFLSLIIILAVLTLMLSSVPGTFTLGCLFEAELLREYLSVVVPSSNQLQKVSFILLGLPLLLWGAHSPEALGQAFTVTCFVSMIGAMIFSPSLTPKVFENLALQLLGYAYVGWLGIGHVGLLFTHYGCALIVMVIWVTACGENGALFIGSWVKGPKIFARVSPNKTLSGVLAQVVASIFGALVFPFILNYTTGHNLPPISKQQLVVAGAGMGVMGTVGDLFESFMKRCFGKKDMGAILPGWGGLFDRMDGLIFNWPFMFYFLRVFLTIERRT